MPRINYSDSEYTLHSKKRLVPEEYAESNIDTKAPLTTHFANVEIPIPHVFKKRYVGTGKLYKEDSKD